MMCLILILFFRSLTADQVIQWPPDRQKDKYKVKVLQHIVVAKVDGHADKVTQVVKKDRGGKGV